MMNSAKFALLLLFAVAAGMHAQDNSAKAAAATNAVAPAATTTPAPVPPRATNRRTRSGSRGSNGAPAATETAEVSVAGGKGDDTATAIDPSSSSLAIPGFQNTLGVRTGMAIHVRLKQAVNSAHAKNGDMLDGVLAAPLGRVPAGAPVKLTVVAAAAAGTMTSAGEISLQVVSVNGETILSNVITAEGEQGTSLSPDGLVSRGTEASFTPDKPIQLPAA
jgi:hypothetical protein